MNYKKPQHFIRTPWMEGQIRQIGRSRFPSTYWPALDKVISTCLETHSFIILKEGDHSAICQWQIAEPGIPTIAAFILVCPPFSEDIWDYGLQHTPVASMFEIAFVAVATDAEGRGYAKQLLQHVLQLGPSYWLHVDTVNARAKRLYESLGMKEFRRQLDPYGEDGFVLVHESDGRLQSRWNSHMKVGSALFDTCQCQAEQTLCRGIFSPPCLTGY